MYTGVILIDVQVNNTEFAKFNGLLDNNWFTILHSHKKHTSYVKIIFCSLLKTLKNIVVSIIDIR